MQRHRLDLQAFPRRTESHRPAVLQLYVRVIQQQPREIRFHLDASRLFQSALQGNIAVRFPVPAELFQVQRGQQKRIEIDVS